MINKNVSECLGYILDNKYGFEYNTGIVNILGAFCIFIKKEATRDEISNVKSGC